MRPSIAVLVGGVALLGAACVAPAPAAFDPAAFDPATVPGCEQGCEVAVDVALADGARLVGLQDTATPRALLVRVRDARATAPVEPVESASVTDATCGGDACVVLLGSGTRYVVAVAVRVGPGGVVAGEQVVGLTGAAELGDLDGDGAPDVALRQIVEEGGPDAPRFWETRTTDGTSLTRTGCAAPTGPADEPAPTALLTGPCPA